MNRNVQSIQRDIRRLSRRGFGVRHGRDFSWVSVDGLTLPQLAGGTWSDANGRPIRHTSVLIDIPPDFPRHPPGRGFAHPSHAVHVPDLRFKGRRIRELHQCSHQPWFWICFREMHWERGFGLLELVQIIESSLAERAL